MQDNALYVYGIVKFEFDLGLRSKGINGKGVYLMEGGKFSALVHDCEGKPYTSEDPNKIKELIIAHNKVLDIAMRNYGGAIPLHFNTIIKKGKISAQYNLKKWLEDDEDRLEKIWDKVKGKREYGIRVYYDRDKLIHESRKGLEVREMNILKGKGQGLTYLLRGKIKSEVNEILQKKINKFKQHFYKDIKKIIDDIVVNVSRIAIDEEKDLLLSVSILINEEQIDDVKEVLRRKEEEGLLSNLSGSFAPYSFVEDGNK